MSSTPREEAQWNSGSDTPCKRREPEREDWDLIHFLLQYVCKRGADPVAYADYWTEFSIGLFELDEMYAALGDRLLEVSELANRYAMAIEIDPGSRRTSWRELRVENGPAVPQIVQRALFGSYPV